MKAETEYWADGVVLYQGGDPVRVLVPPRYDLVSVGGTRQHVREEGCDRMLCGWRPVLGSFHLSMWRTEGYARVCGRCVRILRGRMRKLG